MNEEQIADFWNCFKEYVDKKQLSTVAEKFVDLCVDYGASDTALQNCYGTDDHLDDAIHYYLDDNADDILEEEEDWD